MDVNLEQLIQELRTNAIEALDNLDDYARMNFGVDAFGPRGVLEGIIPQAADAIESLQRENERLRNLAQEQDSMLARKPCQDNRCVKFAELQQELEALQHDVTNCLNSASGEANYAEELRAENAKLKHLWANAQADLSELSDEHVKLQRELEEARKECAEADSEWQKAVDTLGIIANQGSGKPASTDKADCMAAIASIALKEIAVGLQQGENVALNKAPWPDFAGHDIFEGDTIRHPSGEQGKVIFLESEQDPGDKWRVDYGNSGFSRLSLQIGNKGKAVVVRNAAARQQQG